MAGRPCAPFWPYTSNSLTVPFTLTSMRNAVMLSFLTLGPSDTKRTTPCALKSPKTKPFMPSLYMERSISGW